MYNQKKHPFPVTSCGRRRSNMMSSPLNVESQEFMGKNQLVDRLGAQVGNQDLANNILKERGDMNPDGSLTPEGQSRDNMTAAERALDRDNDGRNRIYKPETNSTVLARKKSNEPRKTTKGKGRNFRTTEEGAGMTAKGVASYKAKNPGSKLKTAVTGKVKAGSKDAGRRKSFCARSKGWTGERGKAARARWKC